MKDQTTTTTTAKADARQATKDRLANLAEKRNALLTALEQSETIRADFERVAFDLADTIAQIATYKTLLKLSDGAKDISQNGADACANMLRSFPLDMHIYRTGDLTAIYSDAMDIYQTAFFEVWQILSRAVPLTLEDAVQTRVLKNGTEKNYTIFQTACKAIREYIHSWSTSQDFKKLHYVLGYTENGEQVTTSKRPKDDLADIDETDRTRLFKKHGLTAQQQEVLSLVIRGENADTIATLLNMPLRTVQDNIKRAKAKFTTASAYAEYMTAKNAEKLAKAKAEKDTADALYMSVYAKAQERTAKALQAWKSAFYADKRAKA